MQLQTRCFLGVRSISKSPTMSLTTKWFQVVEAIPQGRATRTYKRPPAVQRVESFAIMIVYRNVSTCIPKILPSPVRVRWQYWRQVILWVCLLRKSRTYYTQLHSAMQGVSSRTLHRNQFSFRRFCNFLVASAGYIFGYSVHCPRCRFEYTGSE